MAAASKKFLIAPLSTGLELDIKPFMIPDDAYSILQNVYLFRGRLRKRIGSQLMNQAQPPQVQPNYSRLRVKVDTTLDDGTVSGSAPGAKFAIGQAFSIGDIIFTVYQSGAMKVAASLPLLIGTTDVSGAFTAALSDFWPPSYIVGQTFTVGSETFTVSALGTPAALTASGTGSGTINTTTGALSISSPANPLTNVYFNTTITASFNTTTGAYAFTGVPGLADVYFYPDQPVMGLPSYENGTVNALPTIAFDTQFAYQRAGAGVLEAWERMDTETASGDSVWTGTDTNFFWTCNWQSAPDKPTILYVTNFKQADFMRYLDTVSLTWTTLRPKYDGVNYIDTARIILPFKNRLILLNVIESQTGGTKQNRCRFSWNGDPTDANAWDQVTPGRGGFIDAPITEPIITARIFKDRCIVYFSNSTWELVYTRNEVLPFLWQQINSELGAQSTFSSVPFDTNTLAIGNVGIHSCNGSSVERIDQKIPDTVFGFEKDGPGVQRVWGIRDYFLEQVYWVYPSSGSTYPDSMLVYNYKLGSWAFNDDSITALGYYMQQSEETWASSNMSWDDWNVPWGSVQVQKNFRQVLAGNQEGFTFIMQDLVNRNAPSLQITDITLPVAPTLPDVITITAINHNIAVGSYVLIEHCVGITDFNNKIFYVYEVPTADTFTISFLGVTGTYLGGGTIALVSQIEVLTKEFNLFGEGRNTYFSKVDYYVDNESLGVVAIDATINNKPYSQGVLVGNNQLQLYPYTVGQGIGEQDSERLWHTKYYNAEGNTVSFYMYYDDNIMTAGGMDITSVDLAVSPLVDFQLHAMIIHGMPTSYRVY